jgi:hypothetical protein
VLGCRARENKINVVRRRFGIISTTDTFLGFVVKQSVYRSDVAPENSGLKLQGTGLSET